VGALRLLQPVFAVCGEGHAALSGPLRRIIPAMGPIDSASLLVAFILCVIKAIVLFMVVTFQPIIWISALLILKTVGC
jgi:YggT family protein